MIFTFNKLKKQLNDIKFVTLENYQLGYAGVIQLIQIIQNDINFSSILKNLFSLLLFNCYSYEFNNESRGVLFFYSHNFISRRDHLRSFLKVTECIKEKSVVIGITAKRNLALGNLKNIFLLPIWLYQLKDIELGFKKKFQIALFIASMSNWVCLLNKSKNCLKNYSALVTLFDVNSYENLLVQYFKSINIPTATLQHGHFNSTQSEKGDLYNVGIAFEGFVSDKFFAWGEYTKNEAIRSGIDANRIQCVGCPKYIGYKKKVDVKPNLRFGVILDGGGEHSREANIAIIKIANTIAQERNMKYVIKPHPVSDMLFIEPHINKKFLERIAEKSETVEVFAESVSFSIAMGSSVYSELLYLGMNVYRYVNGKFIDGYRHIKWGSFKNVNELLNLIGLEIERPDYINDMKKKVADMLCEPGNIEENYRKAIKELIQNSY